MRRQTNTELICDCLLRLLVASRREIAPGLLLRLPRQVCGVQPTRADPHRKSHHLGYDAPRRQILFRRRRPTHHRRQRRRRWIRTATGCNEGRGGQHQTRARLARARNEIVLRDGSRNAVFRGTFWYVITAVRQLCCPSRPFYFAAVV